MASWDTRHALNNNFMNVTTAVLKNVQKFWRIIDLEQQPYCCLRADTTNDEKVTVYNIFCILYMFAYRKKLDTTKEDFEAWLISETFQDKFVDEREKFKSPTNKQKLYMIAKYMFSFSMVKYEGESFEYIYNNPLVLEHVIVIYVEKGKIVGIFLKDLDEVPLRYSCIIEMSYDRIHTKTRNTYGLQHEENFEFSPKFSSEVGFFTYHLKKRVQGFKQKIIIADNVLQTMHTICELLGMEIGLVLDKYIAALKRLKDKFNIQDDAEISEIDKLAVFAKHGVEFNIGLCTIDDDTHSLGKINVLFSDGKREEMILCVTRQPNTIRKVLNKNDNYGVLVKRQKGLRFSIIKPTSATYAIDSLKVFKLNGNDLNGRLHGHGFKVVSYPSKATFIDFEISQQTDIPFKVIQLFEWIVNRQLISIGNIIDTSKELLIKYNLPHEYATGSSFEINIALFKAYILHELHVNVLLISSEYELVLGDPSSHNAFVYNVEQKLVKCQPLSDQLNIRMSHALNVPVPISYEKPTEDMVNREMSLVYPKSILNVHKYGIKPIRSAFEGRLPKSKNIDLVSFNGTLDPDAYFNWLFQVYDFDVNPKPKKQAEIESTENQEHKLPYDDLKYDDIHTHTYLQPYQLANASERHDLNLCLYSKLSDAVEINFVNISMNWVFMVLVLESDEKEHKEEQEYHQMEYHLTYYMFTHNKSKSIQPIFSPSEAKQILASYGVDIEKLTVKNKIRMEKQNTITIRRKSIETVRERIAEQRKRAAASVERKRAAASVERKRAEASIQQVANDELRKSEGFPEGFPEGSPKSSLNPSWQRIILPKQTPKLLRHLKNAKRHIRNQFRSTEEKKRSMEQSNARSVQRKQINETKSASKGLAYDAKRFMRVMKRKYQKVFGNKAEAQNEEYESLLKHNRERREKKTIKQTS